MLYGSISHWRKQLTAGAITPTELVQELARITEEKNAGINAYISWDTDAALAAAAKADLSQPLGGIPIAIKDNINLAGEPTRCASKMLHNFISPYDATAVTKLKAAGAIPFGRANMDEFAMGSAGKNSAYGLTENPAAPGHVPGGSSSGSAAAVAAGMAIAALGSDTGGSIRQPASHCGIVGLKPTYGRISRYGLVAFASSLDQIGPLTQNVEDTAGLGQSIAGMRIGLPKEYLSSGNSPQVTAAIELTVQKLKELGAEIVEISLPHSEAVVSAYYIIACAEASSNLSRFDGIRYGYRAENTNGLDDLYSKSRAQGFGPEVKRRIILGTYVLSSGFYDAYYAKAQKVRALVAQDFEEAFKQVDLIMGPVAPTAAPELHNSGMSPLQVYLSDIYTIPANLAGLPGISIPTPQQGGLPVGIQLLGKHYAETDLLRAASALETAFS